MSQRYLLLPLLAVVTVACSGSEPDVDSTTAAATVAGIVDDAEDDLSEDGFAELEQCPHDPGGALLARATTDLDSDDVLAAMEVALDPGVFDTETELDPLVTCDRFDELSGVGLLVSAAPSEFDRYVEAIAIGDDSEVEPDIDRLSTVDHRGGQLHRVCVEGPEEDGFSDYCEVAWMDDDLLIGLYVSGQSSLGTDMDALEMGLTSIIDDVVANLGGADENAAGQT